MMEIAVGSGTMLDEVEWPRVHTPADVGHLAKSERRRPRQVLSGFDVVSVLDRAVWGEPLLIRLGDKGEG